MYFSDVSCALCVFQVCCYNRKHCWPLLIDPDQQAELWVRTIQQGSALLMAEQDNSDRMNGNVLLLSVYKCNHFLKFILFDNYQTNTEHVISTGHSLFSLPPQWQQKEFNWKLYNPYQILFNYIVFKYFHSKAVNL